MTASRKYPAWPAELEAQARDLYERSGLSAAQVGERIGKTKNAVIGYGRRRGWLRVRIEAAPKPKRIRKPLLIRPKNVPLPKMPAVNRTGTILDDGCRYPLWSHGDRAPHPRRFCGEAVVAYETHAGAVRKPWCVACYARCTTMTDPNMPIGLRAQVDALRYGQRIAA